jgi:hypothetical protein
MEDRIAGPWRRRIEIAAIVIVIVLGGIVWYEHDSRVADEALTKERDKQRDAEVATLKQSIQMTQAHIDSNDRLAERTQATLDTLVRSQATLNATMAGLKTQEKEQLDKVKTMSTPQRLAFLGAEAGPATGEKVTIEATTDQLGAISSKLVSFHACEAQASIKDQQASNCESRNVEGAKLLALAKDTAKQQEGIADDYKNQLAIANQKYKDDMRTVKGSLGHRILTSPWLWGPVMTFVGYEIGAASQAQITVGGVAKRARR